MFQQLVQQFTGSPQGQTALQRLQQQGFAPQQAHQIIGAALPAAAQSLGQARSSGMAAQRPGGPQGLMDMGNSHYVTNFLSGAVSGMLRGEGMMNSAVDGLQGVVGGHVAQVIASRFGLPQRVAGTVGAIVTPLAIDFLWDRMGGGDFSVSNLMGGGAAAASNGWGGAPPAPGGFAQQMLGGGSPAPTGATGAAGFAQQVFGTGPTVPGGIGGVMQQFLGGGSPAAPNAGSAGWGGGGAAGPSGGASGGGVSPTVQGGLGGILGNLFGGSN